MSSTTSMASDPAPLAKAGYSKEMMRGVITASFVGTTIEWYDIFLYGTASTLVFNTLFFPDFDPLAGTLASFATFGAGFLARPLGGIVFGHFWDRVGRKEMLVWSLVGTGIATFLIGPLPTFSQIGAISLTALLATGWGVAIAIPPYMTLVAVLAFIAVYFATHPGRKWEEPPPSSPQSGGTGQGR